MDELESVHENVREDHGDQTNEATVAIAEEWEGEPSATTSPKLDPESEPTNGVMRVGYAAISRVDTTRREIELCATSEAIDSYGTVFDYAASKDAFTRWIGNVREMHERRAVGSRVGVRCDDDERKVYVRVRISRGARDTWEKICDGTLRGASIGAANVTWERQTRVVSGGQRVLRVATRYDLAELSLVDNPSNPDALGLCIVRDAMPDTLLLDTLDTSSEETPIDGASLPMSALGAPAKDSQELTTSPVAPLPVGEGWPKAGVRLARAIGPFSAANAGAPDAGVPEAGGARPTSFLGQGPVGNARERLHSAARGILLGCGCVRCVGALAALGEDAGEDRGEDAGDPNRDEVGMDDGEARRVAVRVAAAGLAASAALGERIESGMARLAERLEDRLEERLGTHLGQVGALVEEMRVLGERVASLEAQPLPGGPVARPVGQSAARPMEKTHALTPGGGEGQAARGGEAFRALEALAGRLRDPQAQMAVAAELIRLQRGEE